MSDLIKQKYEYWLNSDIFDDEIHNELKLISNDESEINDRFYKDLKFGTGGMRGIIGAGTNRMNIYTVGLATQGLADYITLHNGQNKGVAIAYDSRHMSYQFAILSACILNANNIKTYLFDELRPTPELSFAVRELGCIAGIVITASHNPPEYNGYKVYWEDGGQITDEHADGIISAIEAVGGYEYIKGLTINCKISVNKFLDHNIIYNIYHLNTMIGKVIDDRYIEELKKLICRYDVINEAAESLRIVYTPLHGTGGTIVSRMFEDLGFKNVWIVPEQEKPDADFPTVRYPNPEDSDAFRLALELAYKKRADIVLATDPDADRLGLYAFDKRSEKYIPFTGNMSGIMIADYLMEYFKENDKLNDNSAIVTTIVSTKMIKAMADYYGIGIIETLTGFKYIGEQIKFFEEEKKAGRKDVPEFIFGFEESYGCLAGTYARDKDAVAAVIMLCEVAAYCARKNITLCDRMNELYRKYGYYRETLISKTLLGLDGSKIIDEYMMSLRKALPTKIGGVKVIKFEDYSSNEISRHMYEFIKNGISIPAQLEPVKMPYSNVMYFEMSDGSWVCVRPSGTEPKIKFYIGVHCENMDEAEKRLNKMKDIFENAI